MGENIVFLVLGVDGFIMKEIKLKIAKQLANGYRNRKFRAL